MYPTARHDLGPEQSPGPTHTAPWQAGVPPMWSAAPPPWAALPAGEGLPPGAVAPPLLLPSWHMPAMPPAPPGFNPFFHLPRFGMPPGKQSVHATDEAAHGVVWCFRCRCVYTKLLFALTRVPLIYGSQFRPFIN